jgi:hypothetical protein
LTPLATGSLEPSLLVFSTPGGLTSIDMVRINSHNQPKETMMGNLGKVAYTGRDRGFSPSW